MPTVKVLASGMSHATKETPASLSAKIKPAFLANLSNFAMANVAPVRFAAAMASANCTRLFFFPLSISVNSATMVPPARFACSATVAV